VETVILRAPRNGKLARRSVNRRQPTAFDKAKVRLELWLSERDHLTELSTVIGGVNGASLG